MIMKAESAYFQSFVQPLPFKHYKKEHKNGYNCAQGNPTYEANGLEIIEAIRLIDNLTIMI
ncbi:hypothetical protein [Bacillus sp. S10(2024)]|uniref:hypothetical protein n=1 Tax=Bacillus sp. S10(2024) TaxID=3162886 RepID=UPI003D19BF6A